jgi:hypothetical protein
VNRVLLATAAFAAAVAVFTLASLPPRPIALDQSWSDGSIPGLLHIHSNRSDGQGTPDEIAAAAARAGLTFVVFTDHGDATRAPDPPSYRSGVLCLDGVEISTSGGHYVALDMGAAPYPLAGEPRDVVEDVRRLGGFGIAAHPDSPKAELRWNDWDAPLDGLELINPDTSWRVRVLDQGARAKLLLLRALLTFPLRASETIAALLTPSSAVEERWDALTARRRVVGIAGADAHAKLELLGGDPGRARFSLPIPGYESSFRAMSVHVRAAPLTRDARADAAAVMQAMRDGHLYTTVDAWASPPSFEFTAENGTRKAQAGDFLPPGGPVSLHVRSNAPAGFVTMLWRGSQPLAQDSRERDLTVPAGSDPAVYRVEVRDSSRPMGPAWIISNPIYVRAADARDEPPPAPPQRAQLSLFDGRTTAGWTREYDPASLTAIDAVQMTAGPELRVRYGLAGGSPVGQFSGAAVETSHGVADYDRLAFTIRAERPMRVSVQVRAEVAEAPPERWQRSIFVAGGDSDKTIPFDDMRPVGATHTARAVPADVRAIMFIVDTTNSKPGASGRIWLKNIRLER